MILMQQKWKKSHLHLQNWARCCSAEPFISFHFCGLSLSEGGFKLLAPAFLFSEPRPLCKCKKCSKCTPDHASSNVVYLLNNSFSFRLLFSAASGEWTRQEEASTVRNFTSMPGKCDHILATLNSFQHFICFWNFSPIHTQKLQIKMVQCSDFSLKK